MSTHQPRPPNRREAVRPPKGPRVPPRQKNDDPTKANRAALARLQPLIEGAITTLQQAGEAELAAAVQELADRTPGWGGRQPLENVSFKVDQALINRIAQAVPDRTMADLAREAFRRFLAGEVVPVRTTRGTATSKGKVNTRQPADLLADVDARCADLESELGWKPRQVNVLVAYLEQLAPAPAE